MNRGANTSVFIDHICLVVGQHCTAMSVIDLYTVNGDRLMFVCNMHTLIENRRKALKFGFLAQLIE